MDQECVRPDSPATTHQELCFLLSSADQGIRYVKFLLSIVIRNKLKKIAGVMREVTKFKLLIYIMPFVRRAAFYLFIYLYIFWKGEGGGEERAHCCTLLIKPFWRLQQLFGLRLVYKVRSFLRVQLYIQEK